MSCIEAEYLPYEAAWRVARGRALIFAPHPDDEVFGCAGALSRHVEDGDAVRVIIVTDGAYGADGDDGAYAQTRRAESRAAAHVLGCGEPEFWGLPDRGLVNDQALVQRIRSAIAGYAADLVYAPSWWEIHPDHTALSLAVTAAVKQSSATVKVVLYEVGMPLHPNLLLDITGCLERKQAAMACFASQLLQQSYDRHVMALNRYRTYTLPPAVQAAEAYRVLTREALPENPTAPLVSLRSSAVSQANQPQESGLRTVCRCEGFLQSCGRWLKERLRGR
jgi:LmbE family N-acetylglucosaminyl deacetylase